MYSQHYKKDDIQRTHRHFTYEKCDKQIEFTKENTYYLLKRQKKRLTIICNQTNKKSPLLQQ